MNNSESLDIGAAFTFAFDDPEWLTKVGIGAGLMLLGGLTSGIIIGIAAFILVQGYMFITLQNVRDQSAPLLPAWEDWGGLFTKGGIMLVIAIIYSLPIILGVCAGYGSVLAPLAGEDLAPIVAIVFTCIGCVIGIVGILFALLIPAAYIQYAKHETIGAAFQFSEIIAFVRENLTDYIIVFLMTLVTGLLASVGLLACGIGIFVTQFLAYIINGHLYGQLARKAI